MFSETIELRGHIIDSLILPKVLDQILTHGGNFKITEVQIGRKRADQSFARIEVSTETGEALDELILRLAGEAAGSTRPTLRLFRWTLRFEQSFDLLASDRFGLQ